VLAALLLAIAGVNVYDSGSVVVMDTVSAVLTMSELRTATERLQDRLLLQEEVEIQNNRHIADSMALSHDAGALGYQVQISDSLRKAFERTDLARKACVDSAIVIAKQGEHQFRNGVLVGGGVGTALAVLAFFIGFFIGH